MLLMIKYSLFLSTFTVVHLLVTYSMLAIWFMWSESSTTNTAATTSLSSSPSNYDELCITENHNQNEQNLTSTSQLPEEQDEELDDVCDNRSSMTGSKTSAKLCTNNLSNLVKDFRPNHWNEIKQQQSQINDLHSDPCWPLIGLLMLNLCLVLDYFWIPLANLRQHLRSFLSGCLDHNLTYVSILILFQSFPQWLKRIVLAPILQRNLNYLFRLFHKSLFLDQPFNLECFLLAIGLTILVFRSLGCSPSSLSSLSDEQIHSPQLFRCLSKLFHYLNIVLFRKTRRNHHRRRNDLSRNTARVQIDDDLILSEEDLDLDGLDGLEGEDEEDLNSFDLGEDMDRMLIDRLFAVPNLWLHTELISNDYIERLPVWNYFQKETRDMLMMVDCNQNFVLITDTSCQSSSSSSSSSDEEYLDTKEEQEQEEGRRSGSRLHHHRQSLDEDDEDDEDNVNNHQKDLDCCLKQKSQPKASFNCCSNNSIENIVPDLMENVHLTSSIRKKIEKKRRTLIRRRRPTTKTIVNDVRPTSIPKEDDQPSNDGTTRPTWMLDLHQCTVCLDQYENEQLILGLPCGHNYHQSCIGEWLIRGNHCCPICRWPSYRFKHPRQQQRISEQIVSNR